MEDVNKSPKVTMKLNLSYPINELVAWAIFGDSTFIKDNAFLYSNYAEPNANTAFINTAHIELMNSIEQDIRQCIDENSQNVDFSTIDSTTKDINIILDEFLPKKYTELTLLMTKKNSAFKAPIWWAALVIAYREMALFAFSNDNFYVAIQLSEFCRECQAQMVFKNIAFIEAYQKKLSEKHKKDGSKGGSQKGTNYSEPKKKALDYHDRYFSEKNSNGSFIYSGDKASRKILEYFDGIGDSLGYEPKSLVRHINAHRNQHFKD